MFPKKRLINVVNRLQAWLSTGMLELISEVLNQERDEGDGKDERTEMERQGGGGVGNEASP